MTDESRDWLDDLLQDAAHTYNPPPDQREMPLDVMWSEIDAQVFGKARPWTHRTYWLGMAATLLIGVGIGRFGVRRVPTAPAANQTDSTAVSVARAPRVDSSTATTLPFDPVTARYLGQATALLIALPSEASSQRPDRPFIKRASDLLLTTRLLLDSPAAEDPSFRNLLEDLELVLVQVVQLDEDRDHASQTELDLIQQALDQRDVIPRLRTAASEHAAD
jgi:hypothetical protein